MAIGYALGMRDASDEKLMRRYASGDMSAFETLYARYRGPLYRYIRRQVPDPATANDLYQGSWERVIGARKSYSDNAPFKAWIYRIARNHLIDHYRRNRPHAQLQPDAQASDNPQPGEAYAAQERHERLLGAIRALPQEQRDALLLRLEGGLGLAEIAAITGTGKETVKSRLRYATSKLKQVLGA
jgi:RNA polymerase sigma-70 factor (ECF subfamily)